MLAPLVGGIILARLSAGPGTVSGMTAQLAGAAGTGPHEVIHLGGEAAAVVPVAEYALAEAPRPAESFRWGDILRLRVGRYRIMYVVEGDLITVERVDRIAGGDR